MRGPFWAPVSHPKGPPKEGLVGGPYFTFSVSGSSNGDPKWSSPRGLVPDPTINEKRQHSHVWRCLQAPGQLHSRGPFWTPFVSPCGSLAESWAPEKHPFWSPVSDTICRPSRRPKQGPFLRHVFVHMQCRSMPDSAAMSPKLGRGREGVVG